VRICVVYDCLFPYTVGGAERWCRNLAERFARDGHEVTYLTLRQWDRGERPVVPGVRVVAVGPRMSLYAGGRRRILPPLVFGLGVLAHLGVRGRRYDVVHTASFPYFSLIAAGAARALHGFRLAVDWHEVWTREYWQEYLGRLGGSIGFAVQRLCLRLPQEAFCFSRLHERRLYEQGLRSKVTLLEGEYAGPFEHAGSEPREPLVVFAGRHIPEKRVAALVPAVARAREQIPDLRFEIYGDGPERSKDLR
jgi:glycosyltransferase involved in cell wall biosynthesis